MYSLNFVAFVGHKMSQSSLFGLGHYWTFQILVEIQQFHGTDTKLENNIL